MTRDEIIRMARECGLTINDQLMLGVEHFAKLVAAAEREALSEKTQQSSDKSSDATGDYIEVVEFVKLAISQEREACAREVERFLLLNKELVNQPMHFCDGIAAAIRARGEK